MIIAFLDNVEVETEIWEEDNDDIDNIEEELEVFSCKDTASSQPHPLVLWLVYFFCLIQKQHYLPNSVIAALLNFLFILFNILGRISPEVAKIFEHFPRTSCELDKILGRKDGEVFTRYVTCGKCYSVYKYSDCFEVIGGTNVPKLCTYKKSDHGQSCKGKLLKPVELINKKINYPLKVYCYTSLQYYLEKILNRPGLCDLCDKWKTRKYDKDVFRDIYDGKVWSDFKVYNGKPFLLNKFTYGLMLNIDWFQPCKHTQYSVGAIYLTIMNLPREVRFKQENVILIGLIPGPSEPKHDINQFLLPLVKDLLDLWKGVEMKVLGTMVSVHCAVLCVTSDIPASRKVCGFLGHAAELGCSKCYKKFPGSLGNRNYSGFDRSKWIMRTVEKHRSNIGMIKKSATQAHRMELESKLGCRYSVLIDLPYFDPVTMAAIDPMHNLYLGTAKRLITIWINNGLLSDKDLKTIQNVVDSTDVPHYIGRIPHKILSSFSGFSADQFKNWTNLYSLIALRDILPSQDYKCWCYFVQASRILCQTKLTGEEIKLADAYLLQFCTKIVALYGQEVITPNMHLHCHLKNDLFNYGPVYGYWLFSYERYNGILEHFPSNNRSFEIFMMKRFLREFTLHSSLYYLPDDFQSDFSELVTCHLQSTQLGSLQMTMNGRFTDLINPGDISDWSVPEISSTQLSFPKVYIRSLLCNFSQLQLKKVYSLLYPLRNQDDIDISIVFKKYDSVIYNGVKLSFKKNSIIYATDMSSLTARPLLLNYFMVHSLKYRDTYFQHVFASVSWLKVHHKKDHYGKPLEIWWKDLFDSSLDSFVPIQLLICHSANCDIVFEGQTVLLMCSVQRIPNIMQVAT